MSSHPLIKGTLILTLASFITKIMGFFYKIFLSHAIGAEGIGIYQLIFPIYGLAMTLAVSGIQIGISRFCGSAFSSKKQEKSWGYFLTGTLFSCTISIFLAIILYLNAGTISSYLIREARCKSLLEIVALSLLPSTLHNCINSWYYAKKQTEIPAFSHLLEQGIRILASWLIYQILLGHNMTATPLLAVWGMFFGEFAACLFSIVCFWLHSHKTFFFSLSTYKTCAKELYGFSFPLTLNRLLFASLSSVETILIPQRLLLFGSSSTRALELYGVLTGMTLPFLMFPSSFTTSASTVLMPMVAGEQAKGNSKKIQTTIEQTIKYCLMLGIFAMVVFFLYGNDLGTAVFHNAEAGAYLQTLAFLCPFFYLNGTLSSILTGLGKTGLCLLQNVIGLAIRIGFVLFMIPKWGMVGYLWGILASQFVVTLLNVYFIYRQVPFHFSFLTEFIFPTAAAILSTDISFFVYQKILSLQLFPMILGLLGTLGIGGICYLLLLFFMGLLIFSV